MKWYKIKSPAGIRRVTTKAVYRGATTTRAALELFPFITRMI